MTLKTGVLRGDGIGPEIVPVALRALERCESLTGLDVELVELPVGWEAYDEYGSTLPGETLDALEGCDGWIIGPVLATDYPDDDEIYPSNPSGVLRVAFDLYANIRPSVGYPGVSPARYEDVDWAVFRQNTEGFYADRNLEEGSGEFKPIEDLVLSLRVVTRRECRRIAEQAFRYADENGHGKVTAAHEATALKLGDGMFLEECEAVAEGYPDVEFADAHVDAAAAGLVKTPEDYEVIVTTNLYGDILSDLAAGIVGSLGLAPGLNAGDEYAMAQAAHGAAPDIAGEGVANPTGMVLSTAMLLEWYARTEGDEAARESAAIIEDAVRETIEGRDALTPDLGGDATTGEFADALLDNMG